MESICTTEKICELGQIAFVNDNYDIKENYLCLRPNEEQTRDSI